MADSEVSGPEEPIVEHVSTEETGPNMGPNRRPVLYQVNLGMGYLELTQERYSENVILRYSS